jgi:hypothetical protein
MLLSLSKMVVNVIQLGFASLRMPCRRKRPVLVFGLAICLQKPFGVRYTNVKHSPVLKNAK